MYIYISINLYIYIYIHIYNIYICKHIYIYIWHQSMLTLTAVTVLHFMTHPQRKKKETDINKKTTNDWCGRGDRERGV